MFEISVVVDLCSKDPLLAPAGVLVFILVYYIPSKATFSDFSESKVLKRPNRCYTLLLSLVLNINWISNHVACLLALSTSSPSPCVAFVCPERPLAGGSLSSHSDFYTVLKISNVIIRIKSNINLTWGTC